MGTYYKPGDYNAECPVCGFWVKGSELKQRWDGLWVCRDDWTPRHPSEFYRAKPEINTVRNPAPKTAGLFRDLGALLDSDGDAITMTTFGYPIQTETGSNA